MKMCEAICELSSSTISRPTSASMPMRNAPAMPWDMSRACLLCTWPRGGKPTLPFVYSDEVWTGIEYQVASHLIAEGFVKEGLTIVKALRSRYDGRVRNPLE